MGGDCSQHRLRAVEVAADGGATPQRSMRRCRARWGVTASSIDVDFGKVHDGHVQRRYRRHRADRLE